MDSVRIELCGGIASGKTTLAAALKARFPAWEAVFENAFSNDFLTDFYKDPQYYAYETEIFLLLQHMHQIKSARRSGMALVCDYSLEQDISYAENNLNPQEYQAFETVYREALRQIGAPDLILFLECPAERLLERIANRGRESERSVDRAYLEHTVRCLRERVKSAPAEVAVIDSREYDFRNAADMERLFAGPLRQYRALFA